MSAPITPLRPAPPRLPPANDEAEQYLLGAVMCDNALLARVSGLGPEHFFKEMHGRIWTSITAQVGAGLFANPVTLKSVFDREDAALGWPAYLVTLARTAAEGIPHPEDYARIIVEMAKRRELIAAGQELMAAAYEVGDLADSSAA